MLVKGIIYLINYVETLYKIITNNIQWLEYGQWLTGHQPKGFHSETLCLGKTLLPGSADIKKVKSTVKYFNNNRKKYRRCTNIKVVFEHRRGSGLNKFGINHRIYKSHSMKVSNHVECECFQWEYFPCYKSIRSSLRVIALILLILGVEN